MQKHKPGNKRTSKKTVRILIYAQLFITEQVEKLLKYKFMFSTKTMPSTGLQELLVIKRALEFILRPYNNNIGFKPVQLHTTHDIDPFDKSFSLTRSMYKLT
jgi:hypothetical protein